MSLAQGTNTSTRPRIEPGSPDPESDALTTRPVRPPGMKVISRGGGGGGGSPQEIYLLTGIDLSQCLSVVQFGKNFQSCCLLKSHAKTSTKTTWSRHTYILNQRTNGPVNAHLISWPTKAQNIQKLKPGKYMVKK